MKLDLKINLTTLLAIVLGVVVLFWFNGKKNDEISRWETNYEVQTTEFEAYKSKTDGTLIVKNNAISLLNGELKDAMKSDSVQRELVKKYRKLAFANKTETIFKIDTVKIPFPVYVDKDTTLKYVNPCFKADFSFSDGLFGINNLTIQNTQDIVGGSRKAGLFNTEYAIDVRNSNECLFTTGMTTYIVVEKKKIWENPIIVGLSSFGAGYLVGKLNK